MITGIATADIAVSPALSWSRRVRRVGGFVQLAFAAFWLFRGGMTVGGVPGLASTRRSQRVQIFPLRPMDR